MVKLPLLGVVKLHVMLASKLTFCLKSFVELFKYNDTVPVALVILIQASSVAEV